MNPRPPASETDAPPLGHTAELLRNGIRAASIANILSTHQIGSLHAVPLQVKASNLLVLAAPYLVACLETGARCGRPGRPSYARWKHMAAATGPKNNGTKELSVDELFTPTGRPIPSRLDRSGSPHNHEHARPAVSPILTLPRLHQAMARGKHSGPDGGVGNITVLENQPNSGRALELLYKIHSVSWSGVGDGLGVGKVPVGSAEGQTVWVLQLVKPIMRKHGWYLPTLAEFYPNQDNLLG